ncbi:glycerophosphodiester phosphodiesterase [Candidatus Leptofilum sp.]|uniref:glycerophosphodiester phosphodiesterase n=1 Tax=Candidatus Leptofilum sp. TaxID=3241576 RepID=UPI003B5C5B53
MKSRKTRIVLGVAGILLILYVTLAWRAQPVPAHPFFTQQDGVMVIAHQGGEWLRPSNTLAAFDHAVELGVDVLEMDIHQTKDGVIVLMHDDTVDRTTDGRGTINEMSFAEIRALDAGHYWTDDDGATYPYRGQGIQVPTLEEIFQNYPNMRMNIEIKQETPSMVRPFCQLIRDYNMEEKILVATFHQATVEEFREVCPHVITSMVEPEIQLFFGLNTVFLGALFQAPGTAFQVPRTSSLPIIGEVDVLTERFIRVANSHNIQVHAWTINDPAEMERLIGLGVNGIITDRPDLLLEVIK